MFNTGKFLSPSFLSQDKFKRRPKNAGRLYEITFLNKYNWWLEDKGRRETPAETWERVTNYNVSLYQGPASKEALDKEAELMYEKMYNLEVAPAGRTMRIGGTAACYKFPEMNFNCSFVTVDDIEALTDSFHMSLCSVGLGYRVLIEDVARLEGFCQEVLIDHEDYQHDKSRREYTSNEFVGYQGKYPIYRLIIGDSKEGWVEALRIFLLMSHAHSFDHNGIKWVINYDFIRPSGERIKTAGGYAAGHKGMQEMFTRLGATLTKKKGILNPVAAMDSQNIVGKNVVTGGNRRSAQIALGSPEDQEFITAKKNLYTKMEDGSWKIPYELEHRKMSNNSVVFQKKPSWEELCDLFDTIKNNGEPGFFNLEAARTRRPNVCGLNPCAEILLDSRGVCNLSTVIMPSHLTGPNEDGEYWVDFEKLEESVRLATRIGLRQTNVTLSLPKWDEIQKRDRLTGVSYTGMEDMLDKLPSFFRRDRYPLMLQMMGAWANDEADKYAYEMRVPRPLLVTAVKPEGCWTKEFLRTTDQGLLFIDELSPKIEEILGFSEVEGFSSQGNKITKCFNKGKADIIAITLLNKRLLKVTPEHPLAVSTGKDKEEWIKAKDLKKGMKISYRLGTYIRTEEALLTGIEGTTQERAYELPEKMSPDLAWLLGLYWGDGSFTTYDRIKLIGSELSIHLKAQKIWKDLFGVETNIIKCSDREAYTQDFRAAKLRRWLSLNGLEKTSYEYLSRIPKLIRESSRESIIAFIAGLSDADGCYYNKSMCIDNKSDVFIRHLQEVGEAVGISFSFITNSKRNSFSKNSIYKCHLSRLETIEEAAEILNRHSVKASTSPVVTKPCKDAKCKAYRHKRYMITDISRLVEQEEAYDIEVEGTHWYYQGGLKSHNTISQLSTCSSGLHRAFAPHYIRRMSVTKNDPLNQALKELGVPWEKDGREEDSTREIFLFPIETGAPMAAYDEPAIDQLNRYFLNQSRYTDHNSSCTIYVGSGYDGYDDEWDEIIEAVWNNWDQMVAVSFLPKHSLENPPFPQMPYEWTSKENYDKMMETFPDLSKLGEVVAKYEKERTEFYEYSDGCAGGVCPTA